MKYISFFCLPSLAMVGLLLLFSACGKDGASSSPGSETVVTEIPVQSVSLDRNTASVVVGASFRLTATINPTSATNKTITWSSSNTYVATVSTSGLVTANAAGTATITVITADGAKTATCTVTVTAATVPVTSVSLNRNSASLVEGSTLQLSATVSPSNATNKTVNWSSSNTSVATVNSSGLVTAKAAGTAIITVSTADGAKTATCTVAVTAATVPVTSVSLNRTTLSLKQNETFQLTATVSPNNATYSGLAWSSSNTVVAQVTSGLVRALQEGTATITVTAGGKSATCTVTVSNTASGGNEGTSEQNW